MNISYFCKKKKEANVRHTYTLSSTSSAKRMTSKSSIIFPECSRISASASVTNSLCQSALGLPGPEPEGRAVCDKYTREREIYINIHTYTYTVYIIFFPPNVHPVCSFCFGHMKQQPDLYELLETASLGVGGGGGDEGGLPLLCPK